MGDRMIVTRRDEIVSKLDALLTFGVITKEECEACSKKFEPLLSGLVELQKSRIENPSNPELIAGYRRIRGLFDTNAALVDQAYNKVSKDPLRGVIEFAVPDDLRKMHDGHLAEIDANNRRRRGGIDKAMGGIFEAMGIDNLPGVHDCANCDEKFSCPLPQAAEWRNANPDAPRVVS